MEGQNVTLELRSAEGEYNRLPTILAELNNKPIALIVGDNIAALAAKVATATIPIVFAGGGDPVKEGLVARLNRPGGNVTGVNFLTGVLGAKRLELLRQVAPNAASIAALVRPNTTETEAERKDLQDAAHAVGLELIMCDANTDRDIETAFATFAERRAGALLVGSGAFLFSHRQHVVALATHQALPECYTTREGPLAGGLMSYGTSLTDALRQAGNYAARILRGEKPADLPVIQSVKFELVINLKTAKTLGIENMPPNLLALADEVIDDSPGKARCNPAGGSPDQ